MILPIVVLNLWWVLFECALMDQRSPCAHFGDPPSHHKAAFLCEIKSMAPPKFCGDVEMFRILKCRFSPESTTSWPRKGWLPWTSKFHWLPKLRIQVLTRNRYTLPIAHFTKLVHSSDDVSQVTSNKLVHKKMCDFLVQFFMWRDPSCCKLQKPKDQSRAVR